MAVYNEQAYLKEAVESILIQSYQDFELIIVDDGSVDHTPQILAGFEDPRIRVLRNERNLKLPGALNRGIEQARGRFIARADADDICLPDRFEGQMALLRKHPKIAAVWGEVFRYVEGRIRPQITALPSCHEKIRALLLFFCPVMHNNIMFRREVFDSFSYDARFSCSEDWELWTRMSERFRFFRQHRYGALYRLHENQTTSASDLSIPRAQVRDLLEAAFGRAGMVVSRQELNDHLELIFGCTPVQAQSLLAWQRRLLFENKKRRLFSRRALQSAFFWKADELRRSDRFSRAHYFLFAWRSAPLLFLLYWARKLADTACDLACQAWARRKWKLS